MLTPKDIIDRVKEEFSCTLKEQKLIDMINALELKLALDVIKKKNVINISGQNRVMLPQTCGGVTRVMADNRCLKRNADYKIEAGEIVLKGSSENVRIEYIEIPKAFTLLDYSDRQLSLGEENAEVYIFHILSREALICEDIERLNNFSQLYASALKNLSIIKESSSNFKNLW